ncbi:MAG: response regulator [Gorillibacterium sp.]|nr:response regulator [Gorillibacterium sp.]
MKLQLLLVDDEPKILQSMINNDWASVGVEQIHHAASGMEAMEVLKQQPIDIIVTDIRMPGMDGLQLCKHVHDHYPRSKCILLSGFGEFEYARQAMEHGTVGYLLKPVKDERLLAEVSRVGQLLREEWDKISSLQRARQTLRTHLPLLRSNLLNDLLSGRDVTSLVLAERLHEYQLHFEPGSGCFLVLVRLERTFGQSEDSDLTLFEYAVLNIAGEILGVHYEVWHCKDPFGYLCFLLKDKAGATDAEAKDGLDRLHKLVLELQIKVSGLLKGQISILITGQVNFPEDLAEHYRKALNELRKIPRSEQEFMLIPDGTRTLSRTLLSLYNPPSIQQLLEGGRWEEAKQKLHVICQEMNAKKLDTEEHLTEFYYTLANAFLCIAHQQGKTLMELAGWTTDFTTSPQTFRSPGRIIKWAEDVLVEMERNGAVEFNNHKSQLITRIHRFIEANLAQDVSLQTIADHVNLHSVYLSTFYKQEMNENISEFINRYRMEKASVLLKTTDIKIYELASRLGFQNPPYFSKIFKGYYGMTPQEYKERFYAEP